MESTRPKRNLAILRWCEHGPFAKTCSGQTNTEGKLKNLQWMVLELQDVCENVLVVLTPFIV